jgi:hypothetical protein
VFLNTMASIPDLVADKAGAIGPALSPLLETQWRTQPPKLFRGKVVVVWSSDDDVVPPEHGAAIGTIFDKAGLDPVCIELPTGNHRWSALTYLSSWCNPSVLLPP